MKLKKNIAISESGFVFNPGNGDSFSVNPLGAEILDLLRDGKSREEIISSLLKKYDTDEAQVEIDLEDFLSQLSSYNLIEK